MGDPKYTSNPWLFTLDPTTAQVTLIGVSNLPQAIEFVQPPVVPEPATVLLLSLGLLGLAGMRRKIQK